MVEGVDVIAFTGGAPTTVNETVADAAHPPSTALTA